MNKFIKTLCIGFVISLSVFVGGTDGVKALTDESSAICEYSLGGSTFTLTYKNNALSYNDEKISKKGTHLQYDSKVVANNLITSDQKLDCPDILYYTYGFNRSTMTETYSIYPTNADANLEVKLAKETLNNPTETEENKSDVIYCNYGNFSIATNGIDKLTTAFTPNTKVGVNFKATDIGKTCPEFVYYTCLTYNSSTSCAFSLKAYADNGSVFNNKMALNSDQDINVDDLNKTQGKESLIAIDDLMKQLEEVKKDISNENNKNLLYEKFVNARSYCEKIYIDLSKKEGDPEYDKCKEIETELTKEGGWLDSGYFGNRVISNQIGDGCTETLGSLGVWLTRIYKALLLIVPIIIVAFGFKDFIQAMGAGKEDELKKVGSTFIKRLIFGAVFVALPMIVKFILTIALGGDVANMCIF